MATQKLAVVGNTQTSPLAEDFTLTELGNAKRLVCRHGLDLRYCHPWAKWIVWDGVRWAIDDTGEVQRRLKETIDALEEEAQSLSDSERREKFCTFAWRSHAQPKFRGALEHARSEEGIPVLPADFDRSPLHLNVQTGTVYLDEPALEPHRRDDMITKLAPVEYDATARAPRWESFLERVQPDEETRAYLRRCVGYSLAGEAGEQVLLILHGSGANGKSTFVETILGFIGDYGQVAPPETFLERGDGIRNDIARLRGARFVVASEIGEGRRLNEALVKQMTGTDTIAARFLYSETFEFKPVFVPWLVTNHRPEIRGVDEAIWRRIHLIPWDVTIPPAERDGTLPEKLARERAGILNWALAGYLEWRTIGLAPPAAVLAATTEYRNESDVLGSFLEDCCELADDSTVPKKALYTRFEYWARETGAEVLSAKAFGIRMAGRGFTEKRTGQTRYWMGLRLPEDA